MNGYPISQTQHERFSQLESDLLDVKLAFVDAMTFRFFDQCSALASYQPADPVLSGKPMYSQAVRGQQAPVLVASFTTSVMPPECISLAGILDSSAGVLIPVSVRKKDNILFVRLKDPADLDRTNSILKSKVGPDSVNIFNSVYRPTKLYPAVALFVDFSYLLSLKDELMLNFGLKGKLTKWT
jgi:hypothetical protein